MMRGCGGFRKFFGGCCGYCNGCCGKGRFADPISKEDKLANLEEEEKMLGEELAAIKKEKEALK
jgi:epoxyqueuosine reductase QueG